MVVSSRGPGLMSEYGLCECYACSRRLAKPQAHRVTIERGLGLVLLINAALALSACGRAGPLEPPPGPAVVPPSSTQLIQPDLPPPGSPQETAAKTGFDAQGNPVAPQGLKRSFLLDPLLQ
jgi:predicted small lipoprotein YifL